MHRSRGDWGVDGDRWPNRRVESPSTARPRRGPAVDEIFAPYRIKEFIQFMRNALLIVRQHGPDQLRVKAQYQALSKRYEQLERTYKQTTDNALNRELSQLDAARDQAIVCLRMLSEGYTRHPGRAQRDAGQQVLECIDKYGARLYDLNYSAETTALKKIVKDLATDTARAAAVQQLHLEAVVAEIKRTNREFERQFVRHLEATGQTGRPAGRGCGSWCSKRPMPTARWWSTCRRTRCSRPRRSIRCLVTTSTRT